MWPEPVQTAAAFAAAGDGADQPILNVVAPPGATSGNSTQTSDVPDAFHVSTSNGSALPAASANERSAPPAAQSE